MIIADERTFEQDQQAHPGRHGFKTHWEVRDPGRDCLEGLGLVQRHVLFGGPADNRRAQRVF